MLLSVWFVNDGKVFFWLILCCFKGVLYDLMDFGFGEYVGFGSYFLVVVYMGVIFVIRVFFFVVFVYKELVEVLRVCIS